MPSRDGVDVARYQRFVDHAAVAVAGVEWWAHKATRNTDHVDGFHLRNRYGAELAPFRARLVYHYLDPGNVAAQAEWFLGHTDTYRGGWWRPMLDAEQAGITEAECVEWCDRVEQAWGMAVAIYTGVYVAGGSIWRSERLFEPTLGRARILAAYMSEAEMRSMCAANGGQTPDVWQWAGKLGRCPGVGALTEGGPMMSLACDCDQVFDWSPFEGPCGGEHA